jgi:isopenicillin-N N-acyltransferase-like protein
MRTLHLPPRASPTERGRVHGETFAREIREIAAIRSELACAQGLFRSDRELVDIAALHLPVLERFDRDLHGELLGIAEGAALDPARIVILNHYTDLKDLDPATLLGGGPSRPRGDADRDEDCSAIVAGTLEGAVLGQTWDMHGSAAPYVIMLHVPEHDGAPEAWLLSITGCLGMAGMSASGVGVTINNLKSHDARVGLVWPALVRRVLEERDAKAGRDVVLGAPMGSGHHYLIADAWRAYGIETSGHLAEVWHEADLGRPSSGFHHENHCLGSEVAKVSSIAAASTTRERHAWIDASLRARPIEGARDLWARLGSHEGFPRSVCTHLATPASPHLMQTCAGILMNLTQRRIWAAAGCIHEVEPDELAFTARISTPPSA